MKLGEYETFGDGRVHCKSGAELDRAVYEGFIRALHEAHERGEVIVRNVGLPLAVKCETTYVEPLTAAAIGEAVAKALSEPFLKEIRAAVKDSEDERRFRQMRVEVWQPELAALRTLESMIRTQKSEWGPGGVTAAVICALGRLDAARKQRCEPARPTEDRQSALRGP